MIITVCLYVSVREREVYVSVCSRVRAVYACVSYSCLFVSVCRHGGRGCCFTSHLEEVVGNVSPLETRHHSECRCYTTT